MATPHLLIFGIGYSGLRLARKCRDAGWRVSGTVREAEKAAELAAEGLGAVVFNPGDTFAEVGFSTVSHVLDTTVPGPDGSDALPAARQLFAAGMRPQWAGYLSSTAVYGDCEGRRVDETVPPNPGSAQGAARLAAESGWLAWGEETGVAVNVFRLPGLYGPGRSAVDQVLSGKARRIHRIGHRTSRVHVDDVVAALVAAMNAPHPGRIYNIADDEPAPNSEVVDYACSLLGVVPPPLESYDSLAPNDPRRRFLAESRLVANDRAKAELGWRPQYPSYREGVLQAFKFRGRE